MRLGQLARQLEVSSQDIITYLGKEGVTINEHPNSKFPEEYENQVIIHFGGTVSQPEEEAKTAVAPEPVLEMAEERAAEPVVLQEATSHEPVETEERSPLEGVEVIKAPKIELPGLKVIGKIELPEPKPKTVEGEPDSPEGEKPALNRKGKFDKKKLLTPEEREAKRLKYKLEKQKREEWEAHKQKLREERKKKEIRTAYYENVVKPKAAPKPSKKPKKKASHSEEIDRRPKPKTLLGRIWRWLNT